MVMVACGDAFTLALTCARHVWSCGCLYYGQTGQPSSVPMGVLTQVPGVERITMVAAGDHFSLAVARDGRLWSWGEDRLCPQENDEPADVLGNQTPHVPLVLEVSVIGGSRVLFATAGASHAAVVTAAGELWAWGHYGIWRELMFSIRKSSTELNNASEPRWHFPSALSPEAHAEWGLYKILE